MILKFFFDETQERYGAVNHFSHLLLVYSRRAVILFHFLFGATLSFSIMSRAVLYLSLLILSFVPILLVEGSKINKCAEECKAYAKHEGLMTISECGQLAKKIESISVDSLHCLVWEIPDLWNVLHVYATSLPPVQGTVETDFTKLVVTMDAIPWFVRLLEGTELEPCDAARRAVIIARNKAILPRESWRATKADEIEEHATHCVLEQMDDMRSRVLKAFNKCSNA